MFIRRMSTARFLRVKKKIADIQCSRQKALQDMEEVRIHKDWGCGGF
jgi:hypothetical protein